MRHFTHNSSPIVCRNFRDFRLHFVNLSISIFSFVCFVFYVCFLCLLSMCHLDRSEPASVAERPPDVCDKSGLLSLWGLFCESSKNDKTPCGWVCAWRSFDFARRLAALRMTDEKQNVEWHTTPQAGMSDFHSRGATHTTGRALSLLERAKRVEGLRQAPAGGASCSVFSFAIFEYSNRLDHRGCLAEHHLQTTAPFNLNLSDHQAATTRGRPYNHTPAITLSRGWPEEFSRCAATAQASPGALLCRR